MDSHQSKRAEWQIELPMPDQSVVDAEKRAESQEHDLALLKLGAGSLTVARFYDSEPPSMRRPWWRWLKSNTQAGNRIDGNSRSSTRA